MAEVKAKINNRSPGLVPGMTIRRNYRCYPEEVVLLEQRKDILSFFEIQREKLHNLYIRSFNKDVSAFLSAVIIGVRDINYDVRESFRKTGLSHLLSISGTHFGLLSFFVFMVVKATIKSLPYRYLHILTTHISINMIAVILTMPLNIWYLMLSGFNVPVVRSFIMVTLFLTGMLSEKKSYWFNTLVFAGFMIVLINPNAILDVSFILSFGAVFFIGLVNDLFIKKDLDIEFSYFFRLRRFCTILKTSILISCGATLGTLPVVMYFFHYIPSLTIFTNLLITPIVCFILLPLILFSSFIYLITGFYPFESIIAFFTENIIDVIRYIASFKYSDIPVSGFPIIMVIIMYCFILSLIYKKKNIAFLSALVFLMIFFINLLSPSAFSVTFLDVGQGESAVIELPDKRVFVVDTGRSGYEVINYLRYLGKKQVDVLILSHVHEDHTGGIRRLMKSISVKEIWDNGMIIYPGDMIAGIIKRNLSRGDIIKGDNYFIEFFHPYKGFYSSSGSEYDEENNSSLVFRIGYKERYLLFTGDIEEEAMDDLNYLSQFLRADILKVPHHGSYVSANPDFFKNVKPRISVISAGRDNPFGHPHKLILDILSNSKIYRTDRDGSIKVYINNSKINVKIMKDFILNKGVSMDIEIKNIRNLIRKF